MWRGVTVASLSTEQVVHKESNSTRSNHRQEQPHKHPNTHTQLSIDVFNLKHVKLCEESKFTSFL